MIYRLFPFINVLAVVGGLLLGVKLAPAADIKKGEPLQVPLILPSELLLPNWLMDSEPAWRYASKPALPYMRIYKPEELNEIDAACVECRPLPQGFMIYVALLAALSTLALVLFIKWVGQVLRHRCL